MSIKPFKDIEELMRSASEGFEQPFDEAAWQKMEVLLDGEKDRKKPFIWLWWLLPFALFGGFGVYLLVDPGNTNKTKNTHYANSTNTTKNTKGTNDVPLPATEDANIGTGLPSYNQKGSVNIPITVDPSAKFAKQKNSTWRENSQVKTRITGSVPIGLDEDKQSSNDPVTRDNIKPEGEISNDLAKLPTPISPAAPVNSIDTFPQAPKNSKTKNKNQQQHSRFYFLASIGMEGSGTHLFDLDKIMPRGGLTVGYKLTNNLSLQTGFFAGSKKYIAGPDDYNAKDGTYWSTVEIINVKANCLVYEIPLDLRYDFRGGKKINVFASAGLSSYIMKKEDYQYTYNHYGYPSTGDASYKGNEHFASVLRLSTGVERKISKTLALHAAPGISIPLAGVGEGGVKLYSAEIMFGLKYQPLKKNRK